MRFGKKKRFFQKTNPKAPTQQSMLSLLEKSGIRLPAPAADLLWRYHNLLRSRNQDRELTRITGFEPMVIKHYVDCMIVGDLYPLPSPLVDVGSGAGFPGIPLKIRYPNLEIILAEPRPKRIAFLEEVIETLGLKKISIFEHKVVSRSFVQPVKGVITRAVEDMEKTALRTSACLSTGGKLIFMKGPNCDEEIKQMKRRFGDQFKLIEDRPYDLPGTEHARRLVVYEKLVPALTTEEVNSSPVLKQADDDDGETESKAD